MFNIYAPKTEKARKAFFNSLPKYLVSNRKILLVTSVTRDAAIFTRSPPPHPRCEVDRCQARYDENI